MKCVRPVPRLRLILLPLLLALIGCAAPPVAPSVAVEAGYEYRHESDPAGPWSIHVLAIQRDHPDLRLVGALGGGERLGRATVRRQVAQLPPSLGTPIAAVNGDFFNIRNTEFPGRMAGVHIREGELVAAGNGPTFWVERSGRVGIAEVSARLRIVCDGIETPFLLNAPLRDDAVILCTRRFAPEQPTVRGVEVVLDPPDCFTGGVLRASTDLTLCVREARTEGESRLGKDPFVLWAGPEARAQIERLRRGSQVRIITEFDRDLSRARTAIGGKPILLLGGAPPESLAKTGQVRHPRTLVGMNSARLFIVVVDGRQPALSVGMTNLEMADLMQRLGCTEALNLDGGGSSTFWLQGRVMNSPSDGSERAVANALVLMRTRVSGSAGE